MIAFFVVAMLTVWFSLREEKEVRHAHYVLALDRKEKNGEDMEHRSCTAQYREDW